MVYGEEYQFIRDVHLSMTAKDPQHAAVACSRIESDSSASGSMLLRVGETTARAAGVNELS